MNNVVMVYLGNAVLRTAYSFLCALIVSASLPSLLHAGAWCMKPGALYVKLSYNHYYTVDTFDNHGRKRRNTEGSYFRDSNTTWYAEYGLLDSVTIFTSVPYKNLTSHVRYRDNSGRKRHRSYRYHGIGDIDAGMRCSLLRDPFVLSIQLLTKLAWFYDDSEEVPPGNDQNDYELRLLAGKSLWPFPAYCGIEAGYRWRTDEPSDEYRYLLEFGVNITKKLSCRFKLDGIKSVKNARLPKTNQQPVINTHIDYETGRVLKSVYYPSSSGRNVFFNPALGYEYDLGKLECTLGYQAAQHWWLEFTYTGYPYGENIAAGDQYTIAAVYYFSK